MKKTKSLKRPIAGITSLLCGALAFTAMGVPVLRGQNPEVQQRVAELKESAAKNKQALAQYTYVQQVTISLKGEQKKVEHFQVQTGPDGKPQKTSLDQPPAAQQQSGGRGGRVKERVVEKKKEEYKDYADKMKAVAEQYVPPDKDLIQQAQANGNITLGQAPGSPSQVVLLIKNYLKPQDSLTIVFDKAQKGLVNVKVATYIDDPKDAMNLTVNFSSLPNGISHVDSMVLNGVSKQLTIAIQNSNYQHL